MTTISISAKTLAERISNVSKVLKSNQSMAILENLHLTIKGNTLRIIASDGEIWMSTRLSLITCEGEGGTYCVSPTGLLPALRGLGDKVVSLDFEDYKVTFRYDGGSFSVSYRSAEEYPLPSKIDGETCSYSADAAEWTMGINNGIAWIANDEVRIIMNGIYLNVEADKTTFVATDGRRMVTTEFSRSNKETFAVILPKKYAQLLTKIAKGSVHLTTNETYIKVQTEEYNLIGRAIDGRYPNYRAVIPTGYTDYVSFDRKAMLSALSRLVQFCNRTSRLVKLSAEGGKMCVSGEDSDFFTSFSEEISCTLKGNKMIIGLNADLLIKVLGEMGEDTISIEFASADRPILVSGKDSESVRTIRLMMPMKIEEPVEVKAAPAEEPTDAEDAEDVEDVEEEGIDADAEDTADDEE